MANKVMIDNGIRIRPFKLVRSVFPNTNPKYLFTAYGEDGNYYKCFQNSTGLFVCVPKKPDERQMKHTDFGKSSGFSANCRFYDMR